MLLLLWQRWWVVITGAQRDAVHIKLLLSTQLYHSASILTAGGASVAHHSSGLIATDGGAAGAAAAVPHVPGLGGQLWTRTFL